MMTVNFGTVRTGDRRDHLRAVLGDAAACSYLLADHEAGDVLQKHQRNAAPVRTAG